MKNLIFAAILLLIVSSLSFAQTATVTATVITQLTITKTNDLAIGNVGKGTTKTVLSSAPEAASFTITGEASTPTVVTVAFPANLSDGTNTMSFTGQTPIYNTSNTQTGASTFAGLTGGTASTFTDGSLYIWMGGGVTATAGQVAGNYTGTINVSVVYP
jgi:hypothetical protein